MAFDPCTMDPDDLPPLWIALSDRDFDSAAKLIAAGAELDDIIEEDGSTFLHIAAEGDYHKTVDFFLNHHCPKTLEQFDYVHKTPLIWAASKRKY